MPVLGGFLCWDLAAGSIFIGTIWVIFGVFNTMTLAIVNLLLWALNMMDDIIQTLKVALTEPEATDQPFKMINNATDGGAKEMNEFFDAISHHIDTAKIIFLILLVIAFLSVVTTSLMIHGVRKNYRGMIIPWLVQEVVHFLMCWAVIITVFVFLGPIREAWIFASSFVLSFALQVVAFLVVLSEYQALGLIRMHNDMCMK